MKRTATAIILLLICFTAKPQLLYQISGRGIEKSYLFATNKYANIEFLDSVPNLLALFARSKTVVTEFVVNDSVVRYLLSSAALLPDSIDLYSLYTPTEIGQLNSALMETMQLNVEQVKKMRPCYLTEIYREQLMMRYLSYDPNRSSEVFFQSMAEPYGKSVVALDTPEETLYMMFEREPEHWQQKQLIDIVQHGERDVALERNLLRLYRDGRLTQMAYDLQAPDNNSTVSFSDYQVYVKRNKQWVKRLEPLLAQGHLFICLDAKYLGGDNGLLSMLRANGYRVKAINK